LFFFIPIFIFFLLGTALSFAPEQIYQEAIKDWGPEMEILQKEIDLYQYGSWMDIFGKRIQLTFQIQVAGFILMSFWRVISMMILGMLLYREGILTGQKSRKYYFFMAIGGISSGILIACWGLNQTISSNWDMAHYYRIGYPTNYIASLPMTLGYLGLVLWIYQLKIVDFLMKGLAAVGRMAFTNYLCQTVICSLLFYSYGFGLFGKLDRMDLLGVVVTIWIVQFGYSLLWLQKFHMGPMEWCWRYLTYKEKPQFKRKEKVKLA